MPFWFRWKKQNSTKKFCRLFITSKNSHFYGFSLVDFQFTRRVLRNRSWTWGPRHWRQRWRLKCEEERQISFFHLRGFFKSYNFFFELKIQARFITYMWKTLFWWAFFFFIFRTFSLSFYLPFFRCECKHQLGSFSVNVDHDKVKRCCTKARNWYPDSNNSISSSHTTTWSERRRRRCPQFPWKSTCLKSMKTRKVGKV